MYPISGGLGNFIVFTNINWANDNKIHISPYTSFNIYSNNLVIG